MSTKNLQDKRIHPAARYGSTFSFQKVWLHCKGLRWHLKSFMKLNCQNCNIQHSHEAEEPSWKKANLFFAWFKQTAAPAVSTPQAIQLRGVSQLHFVTLAARVLGGQLHSTEWWQKLRSIYQRYRQEKVQALICCIGLLFLRWKQRGFKMSRKGNETQISHAQTNAVANETLD